MRIPQGKLSDKKMALFTRKLAYAYEGGIPIRRALELMTEESHDRTLASLARDLANAIECGYSLEEALRAQAHVVDDFFVEFVAASERAGRLGEALETLHAWYEEQLAFRRMLSYHFSYYLVLFAVIAFFLYPCIGVFLLDGSPMLLVHALIRFAFVAVVVYAAARLGVLTLLRRRFSANVWPFSGLTKQLNLSRFCRVLALTYGHLSIYESWERATESVWDEKARPHLLRVPERVREDATLGQAVFECPALPDMVKEMIITGENTGNTEECFLKASDYLRRDAMHCARVLSLSIGMTIVILLMFQEGLGIGFFLGGIMRW
ncbi:MAG: type II secretion system F family protein [Candidatus Hydrogenedentota bacterium]